MGGVDFSKDRELAQSERAVEGDQVQLLLFRVSTWVRQVIQKKGRCIS